MRCPNCQAKKIRSSSERTNPARRSTSARSVSASILSWTKTLIRSNWHVCKTTHSIRYLGTDELSNPHRVRWRVLHCWGEAPGLQPVRAPGNLDTAPGANQRVLAAGRDRIQRGGYRGALDYAAGLLRAQHPVKVERVSPEGDTDSLRRLPRSVVDVVLDEDSHPFERTDVKQPILYSDRSFKTAVL